MRSDAMAIRANNLTLSNLRLDSSKAAFVSHMRNIAFFSSTYMVEIHTLQWKATPTISTRNVLAHGEK